MRYWLLTAFCVAMGLLLSLGAAAQQKIPALIIDGQNNHNWQATTPILKEILQKSGLFEVEVATTPPRDADPAEWEKFRPDFSRYRVVVSNYNGQDWPEPVRAAFESYMRRGGGLVIHHAANNPFPAWEEWHKMVGLCWQPASFGERVFVDDAGQVVRQQKGQGVGAGHGTQHAYEVRLRNAYHPITQGLPKKWTHLADELYHGQRGPAVNMTILATAYSAPTQSGTGVHEPLVYVVRYGRGRVFVNLMGHDAPQTAAPDCAALLARGAEWAATGRVTQSVPADFPR